MPRLLRIDGSATPIIDTSSASRNRAPQSTNSVAQASLVSLSPPNEADGDADAGTNVLLCGIVRPAPYIIVRSLSNKQMGIHSPSSEPATQPELGRVDGL